MIAPRFVPLILRQVVRHRTRSALTIAGIAVAMFLFTAVRAMERGVAVATRAAASDTTLVVYRKDRYCPSTSALPQDYAARIARLDGVVAAIPVKIVVSNCRASLDVVIFRGVPKDDFLAERRGRLELIDGDLDAWRSRTDAALIGAPLAVRRGLRPGMTFDAAGITAYVAGILAADDPQDANAAYTALEFVQLADRAGLGVVTQFDVRVRAPEDLEPVASAIDDLFRDDRAPTTTTTAKAFVARIAQDLVELVGFARWLGIGALCAVLALVGNAIVLAVQGRVGEHATMLALGFDGGLLARLVVAEGIVLAIVGAAVGAAAATLAARFGGFALAVEGQSIPIVADTVLLAQGVLLCALLGAAAGLVPALRVARREIAASFRAV